MDCELRSDEVGKPSAAIRRYNVERSCLRCHERKVRCNKAVPCSACIRAKARCLYPGPERAKRRPQKLSITDVAGRLERLERNIVAISKHGASGADQVAHEAGSRSSGAFSDETTAAASSQTATASSTPSEGFLLKDGASTQYINEVLLSSVLEKEQELQSAIGSPQRAAPSSKGSYPSGFDGLISPIHISSSDLSSLRPTRWQATKLWQIYLVNVDPLVRVLHIPTIEPSVFAAINHPEDVTGELNALLFSIYFAAITSLISPDVPTIMGRDRPSVLNTYRRGLEISLSMASFLDAPTITSLQAMAIYMICHRSHNSGRSGWILNGLLSRAAVSIGLHRDGKHFKLSLLDAEIRRRLWWHIFKTEGRVAEDHGLSMGLETFCDTNLPLNIDDSDISPESTILPPPKGKWTEMTAFLITAEANKASQHIFRRLADVASATDEKTDLLQLLKDVKEDIEAKYIRHCNPNIPIQKFCILLAHVLLDKLEFLVLLHATRSMNKPEESSRGSIHPNEEILSLAVNTLFLGHEMLTDELLQSFRWHSSTFPPYHLLTYALWHLSIRPDSPGAERAWAAINQAFDLIENDPFMPDTAPKWSVLQKLRQNALEIRRSREMMETPNSGLRSGSSWATKSTAGPDAESQGVRGGAMPDLTPIDPSPMTGDVIFGEGIMWDLDPINFPGWINFTQGLE